MLDDHDDGAGVGLGDISGVNADGNVMSLKVRDRLYKRARHTEPTSKTADEHGIPILVRFPSLLSSKYGISTLVRFPSLLSCKYGISTLVRFPSLLSGKYGISILVRLLEMKLELLIVMFQEP